MAYAALIPTAFAYGGDAWALKHAPSSLVAVFAYIKPMLAIIFAVTLGAPLAHWLGVPTPKEAITAYTVIGSLIIIGGVALAMRAGSHNSIS